MQVIVLSCWCRRQIKAFLPPGLSSALRTISPLFTVSPPSILLHLPPWWSNSQCDALFLFPSYSCQQYSIYHSLLFFFLLTLAGWKKKNPDISLTHADLIFLSHIPTISIQVKLLPYIFCLSLPCDLLILHYSLQEYYGKLKCCIHPHRLYSIF